MTMFRGLADDVDLDHFLGRLLPAEGAVLAADTVAAGAALGAAECLLAGITTALDMYFFPEAARVAVRPTGLRVLDGPVFVEFPGADRRPFDDRLVWAAQLLEATPAGARWLCPHSTYLLDEPQLVAIGELAAATGGRVHVHACETAAELDQVRARHGRTPIEVLHDTGPARPGDRARPRRPPRPTTTSTASRPPAPRSPTARPPTRSSAAGSPGSPNCRRRGPRRPRHRRRGVGQRPRHLAGDAPGRLPAGCPPWRRCAAGGDRPADGHDRRGACARHRRPQTGSIEVGKRADLVILDPSSPALTPIYDPVSTAVYAAARGDVRWVVADGRVVVDDRRLTTIDVEEAIAAVRALGPTIAASVPRPDASAHYRTVGYGARRREPVNHPRATSETEIPEKGEQ